MKKPLALIIEDDPDLSEIFALTLGAIHFETEVVQDGARALDRLTEIVPSLILLDLHLPHLSGTNVLRQIQSDQRLLNTRVIVSTADAAMADELRDKADLVLLKPVSLNQMREMAVRLVPSVKMFALSEDKEKGEPEKP